MADGAITATNTLAQPAGTSTAWQKLLEARTQAKMGSAQPTGITATSTTYGIPQQLMAELTGAKSRLQSLAEQDPYAGMHSAYEDVIRNLASAYQSRGSRSARVARETGLASGLSPLEAGSVGEEALNRSLQDYYNILPGLRLEQAGLQQKRWEDLAGLMDYWTTLVGLTGQGISPLSTQEVSYTFPETLQNLMEASQQQAATPTHIVPYTPEWADMMLKLAQAAQLQQVTSARKRMNELFYEGGLGPRAGGATQTALVEAMRGAPGKEAEVTVSPAAEMQNKYQALLEFLSSLGSRPYAMKGAAAMGGGGGVGSALGTAATTPANEQYLSQIR